jgi:hypothetical protein
VFARRSSTTVGALVPERLEPVELTVVDTNTAEWQGFRVDYLGVACRTSRSSTTPAPG